MAHHQVQGVRQAAGNLLLPALGFHPDVFVRGEEAGYSGCQDGHYLVGGIAAGAGNGDAHQQRERCSEQDLRSVQHLDCVWSP